MAIAALAMLLAAGCNRVDPRDQVLKDAESKVTFLELNGGSGDELCSAKQQVAEAQLERRDADGYKWAKAFADTECLAVEVDRRL